MCHKRPHDAHGPGREVHTQAQEGPGPIPWTVVKTQRRGSVLPVFPMVREARFDYDTAIVAAGRLNPHQRALKAFGLRVVVALNRHLLLSVQPRAHPVYRCVESRALDTRAREVVVRETPFCRIGDLTNPGTASLDTEWDEDIPLGMADIRSGSLEDRRACWQQMVSLVQEMPSMVNFKDYFLVQMEMITSMFAVLAPICFGDFWPSVRMEIGTRFGFKPVDKFVLCMLATRQVGKTTCVAAMLLAFAMSFANVKVGIVSGGSRAAAFVLEYIKTFMGCISAVRRANIVTAINNTTTIVFENGSSVHVLPMKLNSNRGFAPTVWYTDEMAIVDVKVISACVMPTMVVKGRCMIGTSTPSTDPTNHFTRMINNPHVAVKILSLVCPECGRGEDPPTDACPHNAHLVAGNTASKRTSQVKSIISCIADQATVQAELNGIVSSDASAVFTVSSVKHLRDSHAIRPVYANPSCRPTMAFMCIDPNGGGACDTAIITGFALNVGHEAPLCVVRALLCWEGGSGSQMHSRVPSCQS